MDAWATLQQLKSEQMNSDKSFFPPLSRSNGQFTCLLQTQLLSINIQFYLFFFSLMKESIDALARNQQRGLDSSLYNKANELQEDISMKKFDLRAKQIHLSAVRAQVMIIQLLVYYRYLPQNIKISTSANLGKLKLYQLVTDIKPCQKQFH